MIPEDLRILLIEDNPGDARLVMELLRDTPYDSVPVTQCSALREALRLVGMNSASVLVLLDPHLPDSKGLRTLHKVKDQFTESALMVLTGSSDEGLALESIRAGAQGFLRKDALTPAELTSAISHTIERHGFIRRISESDQELLARERRFRSLVEHSKDMALMLDPEARVLYASPAVHRYFGFTPVGMRAFDAVVPEDLPLARARFRESMERPEAAVHVLIRTRTLEGERYVMEGSITNLLATAGVHAIVVNLHDVTTQIESMERLVTERNNQLALINSSSDMIWSVDTALRVITANRTFVKGIKELGGFDVEPGHTIMPPIRFGTYDAGQWKAFYERALAGERFTVEEHAVEPREIWGEFTFNPIRQGAAIVGVACAGHDVTHRKLAERELMLMNTELENRVKARTEELERLNDELHEQIRHNMQLSEMLLERNDELLASLTYAKHIQDGVARGLESMGFFTDHALLALPRDVVSGDFLWHHETDERSILFLGDCTGHGVPGALMAMLGNSLLNQAVLDQGEVDPAAILMRLSSMLSRHFGGQSGTSQVKDGMDAGCWVIEKATLSACYSGALMKGMVLHDGKLIELDGSRRAIGGFGQEQEPRYSAERVQLCKGDRLVLASDGYASQFGGAHGRKLRSKGFKDYLLELNGLSASDTISGLNERLRRWMGTNPQVDDVLVFVADL